MSVAGKQEVIRTIENFKTALEEAVAAVPAGAWSAGIYEGGWNARQVLSHIASTSGSAWFVLDLARSESPAMPGGGAFDADEFNQMQVQMRAGKSPEDLVSEINSNLQRGIDAVQAADDALIEKHFRAPWDIEGPVGEVIVRSFREHLGMHLEDLRRAAS
jgi:hypothetical protein